LTDIKMAIGVPVAEWSWDQTGNLRVGGWIPGNGGSRLFKAAFDPGLPKNIKNIPSQVCL